MKDLTGYLPHVNAALNALATALLLLGYWLIKQKRERAHKWVMLSCFGVSVLFLVCYLVYHAYEGSKRFPTDARKGKIRGKHLVGSCIHSSSTLGTMRQKF